MNFKTKAHVVILIVHSFFKKNTLFFLSSLLNKKESIHSKSNKSEKFEKFMGKVNVRRRDHEEMLFRALGGISIEQQQQI